MADDTTWVVDASCLVDLVIGAQGAAAVARHLAGHRLHAPAHVDVEVMSALARLVRGEVVSRAEARLALTRYAATPLTRHPLLELLPRAWERSQQLRVTDALYVQLAEHLDTRVLTSDARLARVSDRAVVVE